MLRFAALLVAGLALLGLLGCVTDDPNGDMDSRHVTDLSRT